MWQCVKRYTRGVVFCLFIISEALWVLSYSNMKIGKKYTRKCLFCRQKERAKTFPQWFIYNWRCQFGTFLFVPRETEMVSSGTKRNGFQRTTKKEHTNNGIGYYDQRTMSLIVNKRFDTTNNRLNRMEKRVRKFNVIRSERQQHQQQKRAMWKRKAALLLQHSRRAETFTKTRTWNIWKASVKEKKRNMQKVQHTHTLSSQWNHLNSESLFRCRRFDFFLLSKFLSFSSVQLWIDALTVARCLLFLCRWLLEKLVRRCRRPYKRFSLLSFLTYCTTEKRSQTRSVRQSLHCHTFALFFWQNRFLLLQLSLSFHVNPQPIACSWENAIRHSEHSDNATWKEWWKQLQKK